MKLWMKRLAVLAGFATLSASSIAISLQDALIKVDRTLNTPVLTIQYRDMRASLVELRVNGRSIASRILSDQKSSGETTFTLDVAALSDGDNDVAAYFYDKDGKLLGSQRTVISADRDGQEVAAIAGPKPGATVQGTIEIKLGLNRSFKETYVSFFVNNEWKSLKNYPPYTYSWDTTAYPNGWHEIQAWVVDEFNNTYKSQKVRVFVNNPGGRTDRNLPTPPVTAKPTVKPVVKPPVKTTTNVIASAVAKPAPKKPSETKKPIVSSPLDLQPGTNAIKPVVGAPTTGLKPTVGGTGVPSDVRVNPMQPGDVRTTSANQVRPMIGSPAGLKGTGNQTTSVVTGTKTMTPTGSRVATTQAPATKPALTGPITTKPAISKPAPKVVATTRQLPAVVPTVAAKPKAGLANMRPGAYKITLNSKLVSFDLQPMVVDGVPLTPFRHLFEQAGGKVGWDNSIKTMKADGLGRTIWVKIGDRKALVNQKEVWMELAPYLQNSRTVVPLSFIKDSLNVQVDYDPATGHVLITTKEDK